MFTMESVAREAGVSASTVSRVLRGDPRISEATTRRVRETIQRTGYRPNPLVSALMTQLRDGSPPAAACNLAWLDFYASPGAMARDPVHMAFVKGAMSRARNMGYAIDSIQVANWPRGRLQNLLRNRGIQGVLLPFFEDYQGRATNIPLPLDKFTIVGVGMRFEEPGLHYASDDQYESGRLAVQKLWSLGYRRIGYAGDARVERIVNGRFSAGYNATLRTELGGDALEPLLSDDFDNIRPWLARTRVDALITTSRRLYLTLRAKGVRMPGDIGFAHLNVDDAEGAAPGAIAGVKQDSVGVGANAVELLISLLYHNERGVPLHPRGVEIRGTWVRGDSVRAPC
jgi:DNA-binding LacI/PurR family transcriptional regulator